jgi:hypothetical protein
MSSNSYSINNQENEGEQLAMARFLACRASLALNNMGVSLLERGCIREAINAFTDSISFMKRSMINTTDSHSSNNSDSFLFVDTASYSVDVDKSLRKTAALLVQAHPINATNGHHHLNVFPLDDQDELSNAAFDHGPSSPFSFPIRIRGHQQSSSKQQLPQQQLEVPVAIILYNLGLANLLLATSPFYCCDLAADYGNNENNKYRARILSCALKSLSLSQCILVQQVKSCAGCGCNITASKTGETKDGIYPELLLKQLSALVLSCQFRVFQWTRQTHQADQVLATLTRLIQEGRASQSLLQRLNVETPGHHTMAPAA